MGLSSLKIPLFTLAVLCFLASNCFSVANGNSQLVVDATKGSERKIPETFFGIFFEEINHAGAGGLWAELVVNRGFEAGGSSVPPNFFPWTVIGDDSNIVVSAERSSCFERNKIALRMDVIVLNKSSHFCGVGISNPGFWGMNIEAGKQYIVAFYVKSTGPIDLKVSFVGSQNGVELASSNVKVDGHSVANWRKIVTILGAINSNTNSSLQITTTKKGTVWFDQVSAMPVDTHKGHGYRKDLFQRMKYLKPKVLRFPGGCYVQGRSLRNAFRWKDTIGPWEERPGHYGDVWEYWTDDGFGYFEALQLAEDLGALPTWVFNSGISLDEEVNTSAIDPFVQEALDGIEFARGTPTSRWGSLRVKMGHPEPFDLRYVAVGNEDCGKFNYPGNYLKFYYAIKRQYPDIQIISTCDHSRKPLDHPADLYDFHRYTDSKDMFSLNTHFDNTSRSGPKAFVSEYAVTTDAGNGSLLAALGEAGFLIGLERNSDHVSMVCYAPFFVNTNDRTWKPDAVVFDSHKLYATPSYWLQAFFTDSSGATLFKSTLQASSNSSILASAIEFQSSVDKKQYIKIKVVNFGSVTESLSITIHGLDSNVQQLGSKKTVLTSANVMDENSFSEPKKIVPRQSPLEIASKDMNVILPPHSVTSFDLLKSTN